MKIQLSSDLHLEFLKQRWPEERIIEPSPEADVLVLAGDIAAGSDGIRSFGNGLLPGGRPVVYVAGNHEYYGFSLGHQLNRMKESAAKRAVHFLDNETVEIGKVRFLGVTLWTDYKLRSDRTQAQQMEAGARGLNDYRVIRTGLRSFTAQDALDLHMESRAWRIHVRGQFI